MQYERIDVSKRTDPNKSDKLKKWLICHYWYFKDIVINMDNMSVMDVMIYQWWFII